MNLQEFNDEFDIHYNSIAGQSAPNIDAYEKSVYLTKAQLELVKNYYDPSSNTKQKGFEGSEKRRVDLKELKRRAEVTTFTNTIYGKLVLIPEDVYLIIREDALISGGNICNNKLVNVKPITSDEFNIQRNNPFKQPDSSVIWRLDHSSTSTNKAVELISANKIDKYIVEYIMYPTPIVLEDLTQSFAGESVSVDGVTDATECKLDQSIHREIIDRAVELALGDYRPQGLQVKMELDKRNE